MTGISRPATVRRTAESRQDAPVVAAMPTPSASPEPRVGIWARLAVIPILWFSAALALTIDMPVARFWRSVKTPGFVVDILESGESFGNGAGVVLLILIVYRLGLIGPRAIPRFAMASLGSGLVADSFKLIIARTRPRELSTQQSILETFGDWWPSYKAATGWQSFPSAHVATAVGLACALSYVYPRGRWVFGSLAVLVAVQRQQTGAHFVSDTLAGAAIAWGAVMVLYHAPLFSTLLNRLEGVSSNCAPSTAPSGVPAPHRVN